MAVLRRRRYGKMKTAENRKMAKKKKKKGFSAVQVVKEMARERIGAAPSSRVVPNRKKKSTEKSKYKPKLDDLLNES
jgi:hypothetical protein